ncbi:MAG: TolC family protein [Hyphomicrobium sp.]|jgi:outer membrane protein TolC|uniref:TolC family protein n=1 Tax=Hyphomicrobium sp. DMF-1 TaxID=3019544 RepID=UPI000BD771FE|nr:TolC family protein [Hyphomicrobium sp. DMF-1]MBN8912296.1 TolC family protein [Hyphomicrobiales bacterium]OYW53707.1 MAG: copper resistance protein [Hyphomicrobium sp. 12-62-95]WBT37967.1 TolC family protein [Hyphomicrobium sp. DMF-1]
MRISAASPLLILGGCAQFSADGGMSLVSDLSTAAIGEPAAKIQDEHGAAAAEARVAELLSRTMTPDAAVQIALLNNRGLQAAYTELGVSEAMMVEASLPPSPIVTLSRLIQPSTIEIEAQILQNVLSLLTLPRRREIAEDRFLQAQKRAVDATLKIAADARRAHYRAVAANEQVVLLQQAVNSAETVSDFARKLGETGGMAKLDQAREHAFTAEVGGQLAQARLTQRLERERLNQALGLWGAQLKYKLPDKLPALPPKPKVEDDIETEAVLSRIDLEIARMEIAILAKEFGLTSATRFIDVLEVRGIRRVETNKVTEVDFTLGPGPALIRTETQRTEKVRWRGFDVDFQIPIYDFGEVRTRRVEETYMTAVNRLIEKAVNVRSEARQAYQAYRGTYDVVRHYEREILPLRQIITEQTLLNYNGMLVDVFQLLADARARIETNVQAATARRDFWLAKVDLHTAVIGGRDGSVASVAAGTGG